MSYKLSKYHVITDSVEKFSNRRVLFGTRKAKAFIVTNNLYENLLNGAWNEISALTFQKLHDFEVIVSSEENELKTVIERNKKTIENSKEFYYVIQPTAMCQLGCGYCGQVHTKDHLSKSSSAGILERVEYKLGLKSYEALGIAWFGSEPLVGLPQMRELTPSLIALANKNNLAYHAKVVTNGLSLKEHIFLELVTKLKVNHIEVTLDGTAEFHDARRHTKDGLSTFDLIFRNLLKIFSRPDFKDLGCNISIRCNVDARNFEGVIPLIQLLSKHNLQNKISHFYVAPIHSWGNEAHLLSLSKQEIADMQIDWIMEQYKHGFQPGLLPTLNPVVCLSVTPDAEVVDAFGNVFDCTEVSYVPAYEKSDYVLGNLNEGMGSISKKRPLLSFNDDVLDGGLPCSTCEMLPVCGGACPKSWREELAPCPMNKYNIKDKLKLQYAMVNQGKESLISLFD